jgi:hypothetical protein
MTRIEVLQKIRADLEWRGPTGRPLGNIVLSRADAETLMLSFEAEAILATILILANHLHELIDASEGTPCQSS